MSVRRARSAVALALLASACGQGAAPAPQSCEGVETQSMSATAEGRWLVGLASRYPADTSLTAHADEIHRSQRARRTAAWAAVARVLVPVTLSHPTGAPDVTVPRFQTWYDRADVTRTFQRLYGDLTPAERIAQARFSDAALDEAFGYNVSFVTTLPEWDAARLDAYAASLDSASAVAGVPGVMRIALSPDAVRHVVSSYPEVLHCISDGAPPPFVDGTPTTQQVAHEPVALTACGARVLGPFFVASGGTLTARAADAPAGVDVRVLDGVTPTAATRCTAPAATGCTTQGPGLFMVKIAAHGLPASASLDVQYTAPTAAAAACLDGVFPPAAATVALEWRRTDLGVPLPTYDTSAAAIARRLAADATWGDGDGTAEPTAAQAYTMNLAAGSSFRLAAMHVRTRELDRWLNITLWWSPRPDEDFGADRPASVRALGGPWSSYKMCVATDFDEQDADPGGGYEQDAPTLAAALRTVHEGRGGPSWCSNPYIDAGPGLVRSNCVGCHQHAMSGVFPADIQTDPVHYPANGRTQVRNNYPADGFWGIDAGDHLESVISETVEYWRTAQ